MVLTFLRNAVLVLLVSVMAGFPSQAQSDIKAATIGSQNAPVKIDLYFSYACPHCLGLLADVQDEIDEAVETNALQITYLEIPRFLSKSTKDFAQNAAQAELQSLHLSLIMQCFVQRGTPESFNQAQTALPGLLETVFGTTRTLPLEDAPSDHVDWQYWPWADNPENLTAAILQPLINIAGVDIQQCDKTAVSSALNARFAQLRTLRRETVPELVINGQLAPAAGDAHLGRLKSILENTDAIAEILISDLARDLIHVTQPGRLNGAEIYDIDQELTRRVSLKRGSETYHVSFGPDETRVTHRGSTAASHPPAPLLDFLFFGSNASMIAEIDAVPLIGSEQLILLKDVQGNKLLVSLRAETILAFSYQPIDDGGFTFSMDRK